MHVPFRWCICARIFPWRRHGTARVRQTMTTMTRSDVDYTGLETRVVIREELGARAQQCIPVYMHVHNMFCMQYMYVVIHSVALRSRSPEDCNNNYILDIQTVNC